MHWGSPGFYGRSRPFSGSTPSPDLTNSFVLVRCFKQVECLDKKAGNKLMPLRKRMSQVLFFRSAPGFCLYNINISRKTHLCSIWSIITLFIYYIYIFIDFFYVYICSEVLLVIMRICELFIVAMFFSLFIVLRLLQIYALTPRDTHVW